MSTFTYVVAVLFFAALFLAVSGAATIWCLNTLFHLGIPYTLNTIAAACLLVAAVSNQNVRSK